MLFAIVCLTTSPVFRYNVQLYCVRIILNFVSKITTLQVLIQKFIQNVCIPIISMKPLA